MIINIEVPVNTVKTLNKVDLMIEEEKGFPLYSIDVGSYIVQANCESFIDFNVQRGFHCLQIGKYCSLAEEILFGIDLNHDYLSVYQGEVSALYGYPKKEKLRRKGQILIGNDVWIGHGATLLSNVIVHSGAVIGAKAVVTKDVPPYAIVAGNPAKIVKYRFPPEQIEALMKISWWNWSPQMLKKNYAFMNGDINTFICRFLPKVKAPELVSQEASDLQHALGDGDVYLFFADVEENYSVTEKILRSFGQQCSGTDKTLLLFMDLQSPYYKRNLGLLEDITERLTEYDVNLYVYSGIPEEAEAIFNHATYFITSRIPRNPDYIGYCWARGIPIISGMDDPVLISPHSSDDNKV